MLISPTEPPTIKALGETSALPEKYGVDVMWFGRGLKWGVQRKEFPGDFLASVRDGRLQKEVAQIGQLDGGAVLVLEGFGEWTDDGELIYRGRLTKQQMFGLIWTAHLDHQIPVLRVRDMSETIDVIRSLASWSRKLRHSSLTRRPGPPKDRWGQRDSRAWMRHLLQGFEGVGPELADAIIDHFDGAPFTWNVEGANDLTAIPGVGPKRAARLWEALKGE